MPSFSASLLLFILALLLLDVVICSRSSSSSSSESDSSEFDEHAFKLPEFLTKEGIKKRLLRALKRVAKINERSRGHWIAKAIQRFAMMSDKDKKLLAGTIIQKRFSDPFISNATQPLTQRRAKRFFSMSSNKNATTTTCTPTILFDVRKQWPACAPVINKVQDQSQCGSCWAVATASAFSDRYCIARLKKGQPVDTKSADSHFSALDLMCAPETFGCKGGDPVIAWEWLQSNGIVTGTDYSTKDGCKPYPFEPKAKTNFTTPSCEIKCSNTAWKTAYTADRKFLSEVYVIQWEGNTTQLVKKEIKENKPEFSLAGEGNPVLLIEKEMKENGPVIASMNLYNDFYYYSTGVYTRTSNKEEGGHSVRLIGWGKQTCTDGTSQDFWMAFNTWNTDWGQNGLFYIAKGVNEAGIERSGFYWGTPKV